MSGSVDNFTSLNCGGRLEFVNRYNLHKFTLIAIKNPVSSANCKRSFSTMRRIKKLARVKRASTIFQFFFDVRRKTSSQLAQK